VLKSLIFNRAYVLSQAVSIVMLFVAIISTNEVASIAFGIISYVAFLSATGIFISIVKNMAKTEVSMIQNLNEATTLASLKVVRNITNLIWITHAMLTISVILATNFQVPTTSHALLWMVTFAMGSVAYRKYQDFKWVIWKAQNHRRSA